MGKLKADKLPGVRENLDNLTEDQKVGFICGLQILTNLAHITNQTLCKFEESSEELKYCLMFKKRDSRLFV